MAAQQTRFLEMMSELKKKLARPDDASDSDDIIAQPTNRGNKLKRKAKYMQEGRLDTSDGPRIYKRRIEHAGYYRDIIYTNPPHVDEDGDEIEQDEEDEDIPASPMEENIYRDVHLEETLAPLTVAADLPSHPSLSVPYQSTALPEMIENARENLQKEQQSLWKMKKLLTNFRGDAEWIPCGMMYTEHDDWLVKGRKPSNTGNASVTNGTDSSIQLRLEWGGNGEEQTVDAVDGPKSLATEGGLGVARAEENGLLTVDANTGQVQSGSTEEGLISGPIESEMNKASDGSLNVIETLKDQPGTTAAIDNSHRNGTTATNRGSHDSHDQDMTDAPPANPPQATDTANLGEALPSPQSEQESGSHPSHRMTTRARANRTPTGSPRSTPGSRNSPTPTVHPFFLFPASSVPDRESGLPTQAAEEARHFLLQYVSKQEEIVRGSQELYHGLLRAMKMRGEVWKWCKADGHVGEMSDGEDWYDKEEWSLSDDLVKGREEEEDEGNVVGGKKRRTRAER